MADFKFTDAAGAAYKVTAPDENAAMQAFQDMVAQQHTGPGDQPAAPVTIDNRWTQNAPPGEIIHGAGQDYISDKPYVTAPQVPGERNQQVQDKALQMRGGMGKMGAFMQGMMPFANGATFGWGDEMVSGINAGLDKLRGKNGGNTYDVLQAAQAQALADQRRQSPIGSAVSEIGGAIPTAIAATPEALTMRAAPAGADLLTRLGVMAGNAGKGVVLGAGQGATAGAGNAEPGQRLAGAESGGLLGGLIGGAVPVAGRILGEAGGMLAPAWRTAMGLYDPIAEAGRRVAGTVARDVNAGQGGLTPAEFQGAQNAGQGPTVMDLGGAGTRDLARSAMNTGPAEATAALTGKIMDRAKGQVDRVSGFVNSLFGGKVNAVAEEDALQAAARSANRPLYEQFAKETEKGVWTPRLAELTQAPAVATAIQGAEKKAANDAVAQGFQKVKNPFVVNPDGSVSLATGKGGVIATPNGRFWDAVKRGLGDQEGVALRAGSKDEAAQIKELRKQLVAELDAASPTYAKARGSAAQFFGAEDALGAGREFAESTKENPEAAKVIASMNAPEKELFARGFAHQIIQKVRESGDNRDLMLNGIFNSPAGRERLVMALGDARAGRLEAFTRVEGILQQAKTAFGNSTTAKQLATAGLAGGAVGGYQSGWDPKSMAFGALVGAGLSRGRMAVDQRVAGKVAELLASDNPAAVQLATQQIAKSPGMMSNLRFATVPVSTGLRTGLLPSPASIFGQAPAAASDQPSQQ